MFHNLFESEDQNIDFNIQSQKSKKTGFKNGFQSDKKNYTYFGKGNKAIDRFNQRINIINTTRNTDQKSEKLKTRLKVVVYQNGFVVNNGEFRNKSIFENRRFLEEIKKGNIPNELIKKGILNAEIIIENKENEIYYSTNYQAANNNFDYSDISRNSKDFQHQDPDLYSYLMNNNFNQNNDLILPTRKMTNTIIPSYSTISRNQRQDTLYSSNTVRVDNKRRINKNIKTLNKNKKEKNFVDFLEFKKEIDNKKGSKKEEKNEKKKFKPFSGFGQIIDNINTEGLYVNKKVNTFANYYNPLCNINIRLFNGEVIKASFNFDQTIGDIYVYVRKVSGSNNFVLLEGFPPKEITSYGRAIYELDLENSVITQKIK